MSQLMELIMIFLYLGGIMICMIQAQRPSFAGSRPPDGLTQKDKYYLNSIQNFNALQNSNNQTTGIQTRFGNVATNSVTTTTTTSTTTTTNLAFGQTQRPPVGLPVVIAESVQPNPLKQSSTFAITQRLGNNNDNNNDNNGTALTIAQNNITNMINGNINNPINTTMDINCTGENTLVATNNLACINRQNLNNIIGRRPVAAAAMPLDVSSTTSSTINTSTFTSTSTPTSPAQSIPLDALGDHLLVQRLNRLPVDKQPFWFLNYKAIEAQRNNTTPNVAIAQSRPFFAGR